MVRFFSLMLLSHVPNIQVRILKFECALKLPKMTRIDGAELVENDVFAKMLIIYKCLKNVAIDCHPYCRVIENAANA